MEKLKFTDVFNDLFQIKGTTFLRRKSVRFYASIRRGMAFHNKSYRQRVGISHHRVSVSTSEAGCFCL